MPVQALPLALAAAKDAKGNAFKDAVELLLDVLEHVDNSGNLYDPDNFLAAALEALGRMHTDDAEVRSAHSVLGWPPIGEATLKQTGAPRNCFHSIFT